MRRLLLLFVLATAAPASAQILSPGELSRAHQELEGLGSCTKCHGGGQRVSQDRCLDCHPAVRTRMKAGEGLHGRLAPDRRACEGCHPEHQGRGHDLVDWGRGGKKGFDHRKTGFRLEGAHAKAKCEKCHDPRLVTSADVKKLLAKDPKAKTFLGLPTRCAACHFDEHRGQLSTDCTQCHDASAWKPAKGFDHAKTEYPLTGRHEKVECAKCHPAQRDAKTAADAFPAPVARTFAKLKGVAHERCATCHRDPHQGRFGSRCEGCHDTRGWRRVKGAAARSQSFHDKTRFPLEGAHAKVACRACHGPFPGRKAKFKGLAFARCDDCHLDAHLGQLTGRPDCKACHDTDAFLPARYTAEDHARTAYPLEDAHRAVACSACHPKDRRLKRRLPRGAARRLRRQRRPVTISLVRFDLPKAEEKGTCRACHENVHGRQLAARIAKDGCAGCHETTAFTDLTFDHDRDSRFRLEGAHRKARCGACHVRPTPEAPVRYRPLDTACTACHTDRHLGQFAGKADGCRTCHGLDRFHPSRFDHQDPKLTDFHLEGRHEKVKCKACHPVVRVGARKARRYRPLPHRCAGCHEDEHHGAFDALARSAAVRIDGCASCHETAGWRPARFDHAWTGFALEGEHASVECTRCHAAGFEAPVPRTCDGCHQDPHRGALGLTCAGCHDERGWRTADRVLAHADTAFPLTGRHALVPCRECHVESRERTFSRVDPQCASCHLAEYQGTAAAGIDHAAAGFSTRCDECHQPFGFRPARWAAHDACFEISAGPHAGIACLDCHTSMAAPTTTGACATFTAACTSCHEHGRSETDRRHGEVPGYQYKDRKCYECHRFAD